MTKEGDHGLIELLPGGRVVGGRYPSRGWSVRAPGRRKTRGMADGIDGVTDLANMDSLDGSRSGHEWLIV
jgi:hypothetical protein